MINTKEAMEMDLPEFCQSLPKVELHAHLNGSLSLNTLQKLHKMQNPDGSNFQENLNMKDHWSLSECFNIFDIAHKLTNTPEAIGIATLDVIREFMDDGVIYLELRSTPRATNLMTKAQYIEAILQAIRKSEVECPRIIVKLLISVNRKQGYDLARENIELAVQFMQKYPKYVVGIDLSGDPSTGDAFLELLQFARKEGLKIAAHCAEIPNVTEIHDVLQLKPDRLGHCTCIHPNLQGNQELFQLLLNSKIPVELCLTSNVKCKTVPSYDCHQFKYLYEAGHRICLATDDKGVFNTSLSKEFEIAAFTFDLKKEELANISKSTVQYSFASPEEKTKLLSIIINFESLLKILQ